METAQIAPEIPFFKVLSALDLAGEQATTERAVAGVGVQEETVMERETAYE